MNKGKEPPQLESTKPLSGNNKSICRQGQYNKSNYFTDGKITGNKNYPKNDN